MRRRGHLRGGIAGRRRRFFRKIPLQRSSHTRPRHSTLIHAARRADSSLSSSILYDSHTVGWLSGRPRQAVGGLENNEGLGAIDNHFAVHGDNDVEVTFIEVLQVPADEPVGAFEDVLDCRFYWHMAGHSWGAANANIVLRLRSANIGRRMIRGKRQEERVKSRMVADEAIQGDHLAIESRLLLQALGQVLETIGQGVAEKVVEALEVAEKSRIANLGMCGDCSDREVLVTFCSGASVRSKSESAWRERTARGSVLDIRVIV